MNEYKICSKCGQKKVGSRNAWFQDFTDQPLQCNKCINKERGMTTCFSKKEIDIIREMLFVGYRCFENTPTEILDSEYGYQSTEKKYQDSQKILEKLGFKIEEDDGL